uniref:Small ribosomal subunit protein uS3c n=1 Tax=Euglena hiemalis TaxID=392896 RepID=A0A345UC36_9EUGL|nr:ribosomal protein S3 [Euglena hiemalis]AXI98022.1 ribosomal protein S3 [Euglena hiemalis]
MGQKVHPLGFRLGITSDHSSCWYAKNKDYSSLVKEDICIRNFIIKNVNNIFVSLIEIKRKYDIVIVDVYVAKPLTVIGNDGSKLFNLRNLLSSFLSSKFGPRLVTINVVEIVSPDLDARLLADSVRQQLEKRIPFRKAMKTAMSKAIKAGAKGIKVQVSGRLNGTEIARTEWFREGRVPLHTLKANIDYFNNKAREIYGILGIKVWVYKI